MSCLKFLKENVIKKIIILNLIVSLLLTSCATKYADIPSYRETISSFLITKKSNKLVIIGEKYHYIFNIDTKLKKLLLSKNRKKLSTAFNSFQVDSNNTITGNYNIFISSDKVDSKSHAKWLNDVGFKKDANQKNHFLVGSIRGKRYVAKKIPAQYKFNKRYKIYVQEETRTIGKFKSVADVLLSPIRVVTTVGIIALSLPASVLMLGTYILYTISPSAD